jgi:hypothetical protein
MLVLLGFDSFDGQRVKTVKTPTIDALAEQGTMRTFEGLDSSELMTTVLWSSMLTGESPKDLYTEYYESEGPFSVWLEGEWDIPALNSSPVQRLETFTVRRLSSLLSRERQERLRAAVRDRLGKQSYVERRLANTPSVLDAAESPQFISYPGINFDVANKSLKNMVNTSTGTNYGVADTAIGFENAGMHADIDRLVRLLYAIDARKKDFVAAHFFSLDLIQHVYAPSKSKMQRWYGFYDHILQQVWSALGDDDTLVVVSDHGMEQNGIHSKRAFYGASKSLWDTEDYRMENLATVLQRELERKVQRPQGNSNIDALEIREETKEHLQDLGYF